MIPINFSRLGSGRLECFESNTMNETQWMCEWVSDQSRPRAARAAKNYRYYSISLSACLYANVKGTQGQDVYYDHKIWQSCLIAPKYPQSVCILKGGGGVKYSFLVALPGQLYAGVVGLQTSDQFLKLHDMTRPTPWMTSWLSLWLTSWLTLWVTLWSTHDWTRDMILEPRALTLWSSVLVYICVPIALVWHLTINASYCQLFHLSGQKLMSGKVQFQTGA